MVMPEYNLAELRNELSCQLSMEPFQDPVTEEEGTCCHTYERKYIERWVRDHETCPLTRNRLTLRQLVPNPRVKEASALLNPEEDLTLTEEDHQFIQRTIDELGERQPVDEEIRAFFRRQVGYCVEDKKAKTDAPYAGKCENPYEGKCENLASDCTLI